jgi:succinate-acetate transporter protein
MAAPSPTEQWTPAGPIRYHVPPEQIEADEAHAAATVGEPAPLGLVAFAAATFTLSGVLAGWFGNPNTHTIFAMPILLIFGGIVQFIAAMWAYRKGDTLAATAFGSFGAFNVTYAAILGWTHTGLIPAAGVGGAGVIATTIAMFSFISFFLAVGALRVNTALFLVLIVLALTYALDAAGVAASDLGVLKAGGWAGVVSSGLAFYTAVAIVINSVSRTKILPLGSGIGGQLKLQSPITVHPSAGSGPRIMS